MMAFRCLDIRCARPNRLRNGQVEPLRADYGIGDAIRFSCRTGYRLVGNEESTCTLTSEVEATFTPAGPICEPITCNAPSSSSTYSFFPIKSKYAIGDGITYTCASGYKIVGGSVGECLRSGKFNVEQVRCDPITCRNPGSPAFGTISPDQATYNVGDDVTHKCNDGYRIRGVSIATCVDENVFSARIPLCEGITCDNPGAPRFGEIYPDRSKYGLGQRASFRCMEGYELKGASFIRCEDNGEFSDSIPACNPVTCEFPGSPDNGKTQPQKDEYTVNDVITFECDDGYRLVGLESSRCSDSGRFSGFLPTCKLAYCDNPGAPSFGVISPFQPRYAVGDKVTYSCTKNYEISGVTSAVCLANGQFSKGQAVCKRVSCSFPGVPDNGFTSPVSPLYGIGDSVTYSCIRGYEVVGSTSATCLSSGQFSDAVPNCSEQLCRPPVKPVFGSFAPDLPKYMYNQKVTFSCDEGYQLTGSRTSMCGTNGRFSEASPTCEIPRVKTSICGERNFSSSAAILWNNQFQTINPVSIRLSDSLYVFKIKIKTVLFTRAFELYSSIYSAQQLYALAILYISFTYIFHCLLCTAPVLRLFCTDILLYSALFKLLYYYFEKAKNAHRTRSFMK
uniref:Putative C3b receptor CR1_tm n=1 Tax=Botryllus schlosseri TaxID=30301 RepID=A0A7S6BFK6_BOTSH|nr:putative C3b receptor CR1_tm [Botryllus schlosseri]